MFPALEQKRGGYWGGGGRKLKGSKYRRGKKGRKKPKPNPNDPGASGDPPTILSPVAADGLAGAGRLGAACRQPTPAPHLFAFFCLFFKCDRLSPFVLSYLFYLATVADGGTEQISPIAQKTRPNSVKIEYHQLSKNVVRCWEKRKRPNYGARLEK